MSRITKEEASLFFKKYFETEIISSDETALEVVIEDTNEQEVLKIIEDITQQYGDALIDIEHIEVEDGNAISLNRGLDFCIYHSSLGTIQEERIYFQNTSIEEIVSSDFVDCFPSFLQFLEETQMYDVNVLDPLQEKLEETQKEIEEEFEI